MHAPLKNYRLTRLVIMATFVTDLLDEGSMISSNSDGESVSAIKPRRSEHLKNASSVTNPPSESEDDLEELRGSHLLRRKNAKRCLVMLKVKILLPKDQEKLQKHPNLPRKRVRRLLYVAVLF